MAYSGGYAGGYADTIVPPADTGTTGWRYQPAARETALRTRTRYRLTITSSGAHLHVDPEPILIGATISGDRSTHHTEPIITGRIDSSAQHNHTAPLSYRAALAGRGIIPDPDEWLIFL